VPAAIARNCAAIQSRAPNTPCVAVDAFSEKSLRVPKFTSVSTLCDSRVESTPATIALTRASGVSCGMG
jgi:hypothetical protein